MKRALSLPQMRLLCAIAAGEHIIGVEATLCALERRGLVSRLSGEFGCRLLYPVITPEGRSLVEALLEMTQ